MGVYPNKTDLLFWFQWWDWIANQTWKGSVYATMVERQTYLKSEITAELTQYGNRAFLTFFVAYFGNSEVEY